MRKQVKHRPSKQTGTKVVVRHNNIEQALRLFKKKVKDADIMLELKQRQYYVKKSNKAREKRAMAVKRRQYKEQKEKNVY